MMTYLTQNNFSRKSKNNLVDIQNFLLQNQDSPEARSFALEAMETIDNGGKVDYRNKVIIDSTLINNERLNCVYNKFKNGSNTISCYLNNILQNETHDFN